MCECRRVARVDSRIATQRVFDQQVHEIVEGAPALAFQRAERRLQRGWQRQPSFERSDQIAVLDAEQPQQSGDMVFPGELRIKEESYTNCCAFIDKRRVSEHLARARLLQHEMFG